MSSKVVNYDTSGNVAVLLSDDTTIYLRTKTKGALLGAIVQKVLSDPDLGDEPEDVVGALHQGIAGHDGAQIALSPMESDNPMITVDPANDEVTVEGTLPDGATLKYATLQRDLFCRTFSNAKMMAKFHPERLQKRGRKPKDQNGDASQAE